MENRPVDVPESRFKDLLKYWNSDPHKKMSETNTENRNKLKCPHTAGRTPFALIREAKKKEMSGTSDTLSSKDIFVATRQRKLGRVYKSSYDNTISKIAEMERLQSIEESEGGSHSVDAFESVMGPEHPGRMRLYGRGVTKTVLKGKIGNLGSSSDAADERKQHKMEEMEERMQQRMLEKLNEQKDAMEQHITMNVVARLQRLNPELRLDPDMLRFVEASSAQQVAVQLNNRPSAGSNNQGGVDQGMEEDDECEELDLT
ncbi:PREDICTED: uncharacterized protein LOC109223703 [Nicotiana attenuata]|uniref:uncharacterized protein LOC109223703 n=1 Tax=Nicotiana attenuata TaxID=49451 RepID=UPI0009059EF3|nr:PREDICTED: uncharacterized protein LOC109223703 [Nicotiana attenuata]